MNMYFEFGCHLENFLFDNFTIDSSISLLAICIGIVVLVVLYEGLRAGRIVKRLRMSRDSVGASIFKLAFSKYSERINLLQHNERTNGCRTYKKIWRISDIFVHFIELIVGYLLMCVAMTYNGYIMIAIAVGALVGYILYGSVLLNIAALTVVQRIRCEGCEIKSDAATGDATPMIDDVNDEPVPCSSKSRTDDSANETDVATFTTVQVHCETE